MHLLIFGLGYTASHFAARFGSAFASVTGSLRETGERAPVPGVRFERFDGESGNADLDAAIARATHVLVSIPPDAAGDPVLRTFGAALAGASGLTWVGYLSTIGVYGDAGGAWIDETAPVRPTSERNGQRVEVEKAWLALSRQSGKRVQIFRLSGIYGPGRNALVNVLQGKARRIVKPGQVFNRIHVEDIAQAVWRGIERPDAGPCINVTDNEPAPPQDVIAHAAGLLGLPVPPDIAFEDAALSPMGLSFYGENKRVSNRLMREELGHEPLYPTYREGLAACLAGMKDAAGTTVPPRSP
jgi:nucleoside-diphosphate-sugar epimerase